VISHNEEAAQWRFPGPGSKPCRDRDLRHKVLPHIRWASMMAQHSDELISRFEQLIRRDPANRGLIGRDGSGPGDGELQPAAAMFGERRGVVGIVTGFFIPHRVVADGEPGQSEMGMADDCAAFGSAETDGPPGAAVLAAVLAELGFTPRVITDTACRPVVEEAVSFVGLPTDSVLTCSTGQIGGGRWQERFSGGEWSVGMTHLVAVERVGPSHHRESIVRNDPEAVRSGDFEREVSESDFDRCFNMRGEAIDRFTAGLHELFPERHGIGVRGGSPSGREVACEAEGLQSTQIATVGIGDGGNEIGMGRFAWSTLRSRLRGRSPAHIPCRIATDRTIVAGTSNLGAYALAASIAVLHHRADVLRRHSCAAQQAMLERLVECAGAVDGVTKVSEPTVDGVPFLTGIQPWAAIRQELGFRD
jgi:hypothetical protein